MANLLKALRDKVTLTHLTFLFNSKLPTQPMPRPTTGLPVRLALVREADFDSGLLHKQTCLRLEYQRRSRSRTSLLLHFVFEILTPACHAGSKSRRNTCLPRRINKYAGHLRRAFSSPSHIPQSINPIPLVVAEKDRSVGSLDAISRSTENLISFQEGYHGLFPIGMGVFKQNS